MLSIVGMGGIVLSILAWQEGGESVGVILGDWCDCRWRGLSTGCCAASVKRSRRCWTPIYSALKIFRYGISGQLLQQIALGGTMIALLDPPGTWCLSTTRWRRACRSPRSR